MIGRLRPINGTFVHWFNAAYSFLLLQN